MSKRIQIVLVSEVETAGARDDHNNDRLFVDRLRRPRLRELWVLWTVGKFRGTAQGQERVCPLWPFSHAIRVSRTAYCDIRSWYTSRNETYSLICSCIGCLCLSPVLIILWSTDFVRKVSPAAQVLGIHETSIAILCVTKIVVRTLPLVYT